MQLILKHIKTIDFWFFSFLATLVLFPIFAPILSHIGLHELAQKIYLVFSFFCHQFHTRSLFLFDWQYASCARDFGIWLGFLAAAILYKQKLLKPVSLWVLPLFIIPIALDGGIQTITTLLDLNPQGVLVTDGYISNNLFRFVTGAWFGIGISLFLTPNIIFPREKARNLPVFFQTRTQVKLLAVTMISLLVVYILAVQAWTLTSSVYTPTNWLDSVPKVQEGYFFTRRQFGECPTTEEDVLQLECLF